MMKRAGKSGTEIMRAVAARRAGATQTLPDPTQPDTTAQDVGIGLAKFGGETLKGNMDVAASAPGALVSTLPGGDLLRPAVDRGVSALKNKAQSALGLTDENLQASNPTQMYTKGVATAASIATPFVMGSFSRLASRAASKLSSEAQSAVAATNPSSLLQRGTDTVKDFVKDPKLSLARQNVDPRLETSATRLFKDDTKRIADPAETYETDLAQAKKSMADVTFDPPIASRVGENVGDEFRFVVERRKHAGQVMGDELKKVGGIKTNIEPAFTKFETALQENGVVYDAAEKALIPSRTSKFDREDLTLLENYIAELNKLGASPTIAEIDAAISRTQSFVKNTKSAKGITGSTNAERLIFQNLSDLRAEFTKDPRLANYAAARQMYSDLSGFIDDGSRFLGRITQDGDFERDASLLKSAVQSMLSSGKKDWLIKLEELTGYPALDDSVIALQAMKDAGDARGASLLQILSDKPPASTAGFTQKAIDYAMEKVGQVVGGSPEEQTRALLRSLKESNTGAPQSANQIKTMNALGGGAVGGQDEEEGFNTEGALAGTVAGWLFGGKRLNSRQRDEIQKRIDYLEESARNAGSTAAAKAMRKQKDVLRLMLRD